MSKENDCRSMDCTPKEYSRDDCVKTESSVSREVKEVASTAAKEVASFAKEAINFFKP